MPDNNNPGQEIDIATMDSEMALMENIERRKHTLGGRLSAIFAIGMAVFHIYTGIFGLFDAITQRGIHLAFAVTILILQIPLQHKLFRGRLAARKSAAAVCTVVDVLIIAGTWVSVFISRYEYVMRTQRAGAVTWLASVAGCILLLVVLECARRSLGNILPCLAIISILYALVGPYLPMAFAHKGYSLSRIFSFLSTNTDGIFGMCLSVSATVIFMFVMFGAFLEASGCSGFINNIAVALTGKMKSGPALSAVIASALMGTINGSAVANVVGTGTFTIPLMKSRGYDNNFAGGVEATASTGGQILPPVMGAGAFIMVAFTNISYPTIVKAAVIPAILYFLGCAFAVIFKSESAGIEATPQDQIPSKGKTLREGAIYIIIIAVLLYALLVAAYSPLKSALMGTIAVPLVMLVDKQKRFPLKKIPQALKTSGYNAMSIAIGCACAGIVVSMVAITGIGVVFGDMMISLSGGNLFLTLFFTAIACVVLGMGLPTTASYVIAASILAPSLIRLGVGVLPAHLFVFYFACLSAITPPVALAAYAGAGISGGTPMRTAVEACKIGFAGFLVPFMFVYNPVLAMEGNWVQILYNTLTALVGVVIMSAGFQGYFLIKLKTPERIVMLAAGLCSIIPETITDVIGIVVIVVMLALQLSKRKGLAAPV